MNLAINYLGKYKIFSTMKHQGNYSINSCQALIIKIKNALAEEKKC